MSEKPETVEITCATCDYWLKKVDLADVKNVHGECRANPPQLLCVSVKTMQGDAINVQTMFPLVSDEGFCGQHPEIKMAYDFEKATHLMAHAMETGNKIDSEK